ncbi:MULTISPECIES: hypothetical protein [unclassified Leifsonia]|uniref:hypothetical protein n=1 Tax=unclassified Leifsonia TaxID=2663824 RepID=UPI0012FBD36B|nr:MULTISPECIES: hypothetical protein [unclassified Leifsonia]
MTSTDPHTDGIYLRRLVAQADAFIAELEKIEHQARHQGLPPASFWDSIDNAIISLGRMCDVVWPSEGRTGAKARTARERAAHLRSVLVLADDGIPYDREVRNCVEHFAERLDERHADPGANHVDRAISNSDRGIVDGVAPDEYVRFLNKSTLKFWVFGHSIAFREVLPLVQDVRARAIAATGR